MQIRILGCAVAALLLASSSAALAQTTPNQATPWQFKDANTTVVQQNGLALILSNRNHTLGLGSAGSTTGTGGLFGASTLATNNYTQIVTQTTNNCSAQAGADMSCGGGSTNATVGQTANNSPATAKSNANGNTVTNQPTTTTGSYNTSGN